MNLIENVFFFYEKMFYCNSNIGGNILKLKYKIL